MRADVASAGDTLDYYAGFHSEIKGETIPASAKNLHMTLREPYGVVGRIIPFNHPIKFAANALAAPLMAGNTRGAQAAGNEPAVGHHAGRDLPRGAAGRRRQYRHRQLGMPAGDAIVRHPSVKRIAFTGSVPTGRAIQRAAAEGGIKHVTLELGGKNPLIAFPDMDPDKVAQIAVAGMNFAWQGQSCGSTSRLMLHESLYEGVLERVVERVAALAARRSARRQIADGADQLQAPLRARLRHGGVRAPGGRAADDRRQASRAARSSSAAIGSSRRCSPTSSRPCGSRARRSSARCSRCSAGATRRKPSTLANSTEYGLTASIFTNDLDAAFRAARAVKSGYVWINGASGHFYGTPFGGYKNSGLGREEGIDELLSYTETKTIHLMLGGGAVKD